MTATSPNLGELVSPQVLASADSLRATFTTAKPFSHCLIEDFFPADYAQALVESFPAFERGHSLNEQGEPAGKAVVERIGTLGDAWRRLDACVQSPGFLELVGRITGIPDLLYDRDYFGGGTHENRDGQSLDNHIDFNYHPGTGWHRRLNLIVYLNREWSEAWGGALELHRDPNDPATDEVVRIAPTFNRCVIFETTEHSWHGFAKICLPEERRQASRKSIALYFYTRERPQPQLALKHSTIYVDRPLPAHLQPGRVLSERDVAELHELLQRRDAHRRRLYDEMAMLQARLDQGFAGRLFHAARRVLGRWRAR